MKLELHSLRFVAIAVVVSLPLLGASGVASAKAKPSGCHKTHTCKSGGGTVSGTGTAASPPPITVQIDPNPQVETGESYITATIQVETSPSFAGDAVTVSSSQLVASCAGGTEFESIATGAVSRADSATVILDDDGNATLMVLGADCAPGSDVIEADLDVAPYYTALGTLVAEPPVVTTAGVYAYPTTSGTVTTGDVETGDTAASGNSDVYAVFYVETDPVYAEQPVELSSSELESRCGEGWSLIPNSLNSTGVQSPTGTVEPPATGILDDDGNTAFFFFGASCAAGPSDVIADVLAGTHPTYTTTFNIVAPQPTI